MSEAYAVSGGIDLGELRKSPDLYPQNVQPLRQDFLIIKMSEADYRAASFLDNRVIRPGMQRGPFPESEIRRALDGGIDARPLHYIFHAGHVGSTLLSRLLDETNQVLPLREPYPLRVLADGFSGLARREAPISEERLDSHLEMFLKMWSRGYPDTRAVVAKATSVTARLAPRLLNARPNSRAVYMSLPAEPYLAAVLVGRNSLLDFKAFAPERVRRLESDLDIILPPAHLVAGGELVAMSWLAERLTERKIAEEFGARLLRIDFDDMLKNIPKTLANVTAHFGLQPEKTFFDGIADSAVLKRYSKDPQQAYSIDMRNDLLATARKDKDVDIKKGLAWLDKMSAKHKDVADLLKEKAA